MLIAEVFPFEMSVCVGANMRDNGTHDAAWGVLTRHIVIAMVAILVVYTAWYLLRYSDFSNDDLDFLVIMKHSSFWHFVLTPADVHYVPLHQLLTWLAYHISPMNFAVAVAILMVFHVGTLIYLGRSLQLLNAGQAGGLILCAYAGSSLIIFGLVWWAHAEHRAPYVFCDVCAVYHYLAWLKSRRRFHLWIAAAAFVAAFGFYEKAVFIPLHMLVIGYLSDEAQFRAQLRKVAWPPMLFALGSAAFVLAYLHFVPPSVRAGTPEAIRADLEFAKVLFAGATGLGVDAIHDVPEHGMSLRLAAVLLLGCVALTWSLWRGRRSWMILVAMLLVVLLDNLPIAMSNRVAWFGLMITHQYRFHYEELQLLALFAGLWVARVPITPSSEFRRRGAWLAGFALVAIYAGVNAYNVRESRHQPLGSLWMMDQSHIYLRHLRSGLAQIEGPSPVFENGKLPRYLTLFGITPDTRTLLPLFIPDVRFDDSASPHYKVLQDGHVEQVQ